jgi:hypothetical protein
MALDEWDYNPEDMDIQNLGEGEYTELRSSGKEQYSDGGSTANRVFELNWSERTDFIDDLLGYSYIGSDGTSVKRVLPDEHPQVENFFAVDATIEGKGVLDQDDDGILSWTHAVVTANYKPCDYLLRPDGNGTEQDRYTSRDSNIAGEYLTVQNGLRFVTSKRVLAAAPGRLTTTQEITMTWRDVPALASSPFIWPNIKAINSCIGRINSTNFDPGGYNFPPGTVLFIGLTPKFKLPKIGGSVGANQNGLYMWDLAMKFLYRFNGVWMGGSSGGMDSNIGHNFIFDITTGMWDLVTTDGNVTGQRIYPEAVDLNTLWTVGQ